MAVEPVVGVLPDRAGIDEDNVGLVELICWDHPIGGEEPGHPLAVVLVHLATEGAEEVPAPGPLGHSTLPP